jgi:cyclic pyranopterin phosphate synthase
MLPETTSKVASNAITKGDVLGAARIAGIQASKRTSDMIPLCHPLLLGAVNINFTIGDDYVEVESQVETIDRTGVEMEAMTACALAALTIYDMCKSSDRSMVIGELALWEKTGGKSGHWRRPQGTLADPLVNTPPPAVTGDSGLAAIDAVLEEGPLGQ